MFDVWLCSEKKFQKIGMWDQKREEKREGEKETDKCRLEFREGLVPTLLRI